MTRPPRAEGSHVGRVFALLDIVGAAAEPQSLSALARTAELPVSTTHRILGELVAWGGVERIAGGTYRLGEKVWRLGVRSSWERAMRAAALPHARDLARRTGLAVAISALLGDQLICMDTVPGAMPGIYLARAGDELPLFATSAGKVLMSTADRTTLVAALETRLERRTPHTLMTPGLVLGQLVKARKAGFAVTRSESTEGQSSVSVPVGSGLEFPIALTVLTRSSMIDLDRYVPDLRRSAQGIARVL
jgi:DNA-binding IclR family transcriptional regulator